MPAKNDREYRNMMLEVRDQIEGEYKATDELGGNEENGTEE